MCGPARADPGEHRALRALEGEPLARFETGAEADFAHADPVLGRFRVAVFRQRGDVGLVLRRVLAGAQSFEELGLPPAVRKLAEVHRGLVLITGPTGSGKTTTTAAMISHINPDVIFIGEMRDIETVTAALQAAETGHMVISTLHTADATETINRIIDMFPPFQQAQVRLTLANSLKGIVCQRLLSRANGGRIAAIECMVMTSRLHEFVLDPEKTIRSWTRSKRAPTTGCSPSTATCSRCSATATSP